MPCFFPFVSPSRIAYTFIFFYIIVACVCKYLLLSFSVHGYSFRRLTRKRYIYVRRSTFVSIHTRARYFITRTHITINFYLSYCSFLLSQSLAFANIVKSILSFFFFQHIKSFTSSSHIHWKAKEYFAIPTQLFYEHKFILQQSSFDSTDMLHVFFTFITFFSLLYWQICI